jgi:hypothetical protein
MAELTVHASKAAVQSKPTTVIGVRIDASGFVAQFNALRELYGGATDLDQPMLACAASRPNSR